MKPARSDFIFFHFQIRLVPCVAMKASASYSKETNRDEKAASKLLEQSNGEIILAEATCITESVSIAKEVRPTLNHSARYDR